MFNLTLAYNGNMTTEVSWPFPVSSLEPINPRKVGIGITHVMGLNNKGGVTIAYRKCANFRNTRMVEVATAYCSPSDTFTRKIGSATALSEFINGHTIIVPARTDNDDSTIIDNLQAMFWHTLN